ncbi:MAG: Ig-like domain-containing protein [Bacteroidaceae bacterium]|nr:Ig-like domain-containing protein [Bacteroidaceae bacterium]
MKRLLKLGLMTIVSLSIWSCADDSATSLTMPEVAKATQVNQFSESETLQRGALAALYESTGGANWYRNDNWNTNAPLSEWYGVKMENGNVISIDLSNNNLTGVLPAELVQLEKIQSIILKGNRIGGQIPAAWGENPSEAGYFDEEKFEDGDDGDDLNDILAQLSAIADNGEVEIEVNDDTTPRLASLSTLDLRDNLITGTLPEELGNLNKMRSLNISYNLMSGEISTGIQQSAMWKSLKEVPVLEQKENNVLTIASPKSGNVTEVKIKSKVSIVVGQKYTFTYTITPSDADVTAYKWKTSDKSIVKVSEGVIKGISAGTAKVALYAYNNDGSKVTATCKVTVKEPVSATEVTLDTKSVSLEKGKKYQFTTTITPDNATPKTVKWVSSDENIVIVKDGLIKGLKPGTAKVAVYVYNYDGTKVSSASCKVTVTEDVPATGVALDKTSITLNVGKKYQFTPTITPDNATPKTVKWVSSDENVVIVKDGLIKGLKPGTAKVGVIVYNNNGTKVSSASCKVTVKNPDVPATGVTLNKDWLTIEVGKKFTLTATFTPDNATPKAVKWASDDENVVIVRSGLIKGLKAGKANVTATVTNSDGSTVTATCNVTVTEPVVPVTGVALNASSLTMAAGTTEQLTATVSPSNATDKGVVWSSSDASVATVDSTGKVTALTAGSTTITATTVDGGKIATCTVTVTSNNTTGNIEDFTEEEFDW